ncbi:MAG: hypothetical protein NT062_18300 [Proteobacteria bacterium]|nr:hypothetical protein [Pseudomonadota bacterium]
MIVIPPKSSDITERVVMAPASAGVSGPAPILDPSLALGSGPANGDIAAELVDAASAPIRMTRGSIAIGPYSVTAIPAGRRAAV